MSGEGAAKVFNAWTTAVKLCWDCPRNTRTYLVQQVLACGQSSARTDLLTRYSGFFKSLRTSTSVEVSTMANLVSRDIQTITGGNLRLVEEASGLSAWNTSSEKLKEAIGNLEIVEYDPTDYWRIPFLNKLLGHKQEQSYLGIDTGEISDLVNGLCIN